MTHYQSVFNGAKMVYRKIVPQNGGKSGKTGGNSGNSGNSGNPVAVEPVPQAQVAPKEDVKARRGRVGADLLKLL